MTRSGVVVIACQRSGLEDYQFLPPGNGRILANACCACDARRLGLTNDDRAKQRSASLGGTEGRPVLGKNYTQTSRG